MLVRIWRNWNPIHFECKMVQPLWKTILQLLESLNTELPYDPAIVFLGLYPQK